MSATPPSPTELPKVLEQLKEIKSEAGELRNFTITFLSLLLYINLIIAGTDAGQILRVAPVTLPLLNVPLPIIGFYGFLPWLLLFFHLYLLMQHYLFSQQLFRFNGALQNASPVEQAYARKNLGNLPFLHWMVGRHHSVMQFLLTLITLVCLIVWPLVTLLWLQMAILPYHSADLLAWQRVALVLDVLLVGWLWPKTLDSDDCSLAWWGRGISGAGHSLAFLPFCLLWLICHIPGLRGHIVAQPSNAWQTVKSALPGAATASALALGLSAVLFLSLMVATLPDSWEDRFITNNANNKTPKPANLFWLKTVDVDGRGDPIRMAFAPTAWLHEQHAKLFDEKSGQEKQQYEESLTKGAKFCPSVEKPDEKAKKLCLMVQPLLPRNMILREKVLTADAGLLKPELEARLQADAVEAKSEELAQIRGLDLQNRNLDYADFTGSSLPKADLRYASLKHAVLRQARLDQAQLRSAYLEQVDLSDAKLSGVDLSRAELPGARLYEAKLPGANLTDANLSDAKLIRAALTGANLSHAKLPGADLAGAELPGADLTRAELSGASLYEVKLSGANLSGAKLFSAFLSDADLTGANLFGAYLSGANLAGAKLPGVDLTEAQLPGADLTRTELSGAMLLVEASPLSEDFSGEAADQYRQALILQPYYQDAQHQKGLEVEVKVFEEKVRQAPDFSKANELKPCLRKADAKNLLPDCIPEDAQDESSRKALADVWVHLACGDKTEGHWVARRMVERANLSYLYPDIYRYPHPYSVFAKRLQQAAQDPETCPGMAGLPEGYKVLL